jgi:hypothetical protein
MTSSATTITTSENNLFQSSHFAMILKYSGISFISGAVNHGFFSGERSVITALLGVVLFLAGAVMEHKLSDNPNETNDKLFKTLFLGTVLSIGLGFFTGGLQHFPDSPERSSWVVPLGFALSVMALVGTQQMRATKSIVMYGVLATLLVTALSWAALRYLAMHPSEDIQTITQPSDAQASQSQSTILPKNMSADLTSTQAYKQANDAMHKGMDIAFTGDADADFLAGMLPHHQGAIDMANVVLKYGKDPKIRDLAKQIIAAQEREIADMKT